LEQGEKRAQSSSKEDDVIAIVDGLCKRVLVCVESGEDLGEEGMRIAAASGFMVAVKFQEFWE
jgi:hypothetical protein